MRETKFGSTGNTAKEDAAYKIFILAKGLRQGPGGDVSLEGKGLSSRTALPFRPVWKSSKNAFKVNGESVSQTLPLRPVSEASKAYKDAIMQVWKGNDLSGLSVRPGESGAGNSNSLPLRPISESPSSKTSEIDLGAYKDAIWKENGPLSEHGHLLQQPLRVAEDCEGDLKKDIIKFADEMLQEQDCGAQYSPTKASVGALEKLMLSCLMCSEKFQRVDALCAHHVQAHDIPLWLSNQDRTEAQFRYDYIKIGCSIDSFVENVNPCLMNECEDLFGTAEEWDRYKSVLRRHGIRCDFPSCNKIFRREDNLNDHKLHHIHNMKGLPTSKSLTDTMPEKNYKCIEIGCEVIFQRSEHLNRHGRVHEIFHRPLFRCPYPGCNAAYSLKANRDDHMCQHKVRRPFDTWKSPAETMAFASAGRPALGTLPFDLMTPKFESERIKIGDTDAVTALFKERFLELQQKACKIIAKAFIKVIEPTANEPCSPYSLRPTPPSWWPAQGVRLKFTDHLLKAERLDLLIHLLRLRPSLAGMEHVTITRLETMARLKLISSIRDEPEDRQYRIVAALGSLFDIAYLEEQFRKGEISPETIVG